MMEIDSAKSVIDQACDFGVRSVVYLGGGEPLLYPHFWPLVQYMARRGIVPVVFTNGTLMTPDIAERLFDLGASVLVKCDGSEATQDQMTGQGTYRLIRAAFEMLLRSGFANSRAGPVTRLGVSICATRTNYQEIPAIPKRGEGDSRRNS
jgi:MoaA/NifB/PqqE/SkfB family radical SAM enzyme